MARTLGTYSLSANIEMLAGAPLDAREIVPAKADLTTSGMFPYAYIGMETYVVAENKKYRLIGIDPTVPSNWEEIKAGSEITPNPSSQATDNLSSIKIDNTVYSIVDATVPSWAKASSKPSYTFSEIGSTPTTLSGYGITDAKIVNGTITLGSDTITPVTDISGKADKSATVSTVTWDSSNNKLTKTINGTTTDVVTASTILNNLIGNQVTSALGYTPAADAIGDENWTVVGHYVVPLAGPDNIPLSTYISRLSTAFETAINDHADWVSDKVDKAGDTVTGRMSFNKSIKQIITGTGTAGSDAGASASPRYFPAKWTFNLGYAPVDGDIITIKIPVAGYTKGEWLSINNGTNYHPVIISGTSRMGTEYGSGTTVTLIFEADASCTNAYALNGADASSTVTGGCWRAINFYNTNTDTKVTVTNTNPASSTFYYPVWHTSTSGTTGVNANDGFRYETAQGTTTNTGFSVIWLGNSTSAGTAGNKRGVLNLYSNNNGYVTLRTNETSTSKRDIYFPDKSGTIALTSDITDTKNTAGSTDTSSKIFLIGATSQAANPQTYSDNEVYVTNGVLTTKKTQIGGTAVTLEYNSSTKSLDFIF